MTRRPASRLAITTASSWPLSQAPLGVASPAPARAGSRQSHGRLEIHGSSLASSACTRGADAPAPAVLPWLAAGPASASSLIGALQPPGHESPPLPAYELGRPMRARRAGRTTGRGPVDRDSGGSQWAH